MNTQTITYLVLGLVLAYAIFQGGEAIMTRTDSWDDIIKKYAANFPVGMTAQSFENLIRAVIQKESNWSTNIVGVSGDIGLMQINPANAPAFNLIREDLFDVDTNIRVGVAILREDINAYGIRDGLAAYNGGPAKRNIAVTQAYANDVLRIFQTIV